MNNYKLHLAISMFLMGHLLAIADVTDSLNYIRHNIYIEGTMETSEEDEEIVIGTVNYYDGLGRKIQTLYRRAGANLVDIANYVEYNSMGLPSREWNPMNGPNDGAFIDVPSLVLSTSVNPYNNSEPFALYNYEAIPLPRLIETHEAGERWHNHSGKSTTYGLVAGESHTANVVKFIPTINGVKYSGLWQSGELDMVETYDEDGKCKVIFTDKFGNLVMETDEFGKMIGTYYVYDQMNLLRYVIPPKLAAILIAKGSGTETANNDQDMAALAYSYKYDSRYRLSSKKLPGCDEKRILYDINGLPVFTQDGNLADKNMWLFHLYDGIGRVIGQSLVSSSQFDENNVKSSDYRIDYDSNGSSLSNNMITQDSVLSWNYYDDYDIVMLSGDESLGYVIQDDYDICYDYYQCPERSAQGMLTGRMVRTLPLGNDSQTLYSSYFYDYKGNIIQSHEQNLNGGHDHYYYQLTFTGKPLKVMHIHETADTMMTDVYEYTYDNVERLLTITVSHDGGASVTLASNTYNSLGQLSEQSLGGHTNGVVGYTYNVRGWAQGISSPHFSQTLYYEQPGSGATPCYNGNISAVDWTALDAMAVATPTSHRYTFDYDGLNRLTAAHYGTNGSQSTNGRVKFDGVHNYSATYGYDLNSNITSLARKGVNSCITVGDTSIWSFGDIDILSLTYNGNQLKKVTDQCADLTYAGAMDFKDGANKTVEYLWDANGNMTRNRNKNIWKIKYNVLNLPERIEYMDGHIVLYTYASDGRKLKVEYQISNMGVLELNGIDAGSTMDLMGGGTIPFNPPGPIGPVLPTGPTTYLIMDYCGNHVYRNGVLERTENDYGYLADSTYYYYIRDYQGNVRAVIDQNGALKEINNYYPYGGLMGAASAGVQPNKYGGKELDRQNGIDWYDFEARFQDPMLPMFTTQDPLAEQAPGISPYAYCAGNPVRYIDPSGLGWIEQDNRYFYNPMISSQDEATERYGDNANYLFNEGRLYATDQSYSYELGAGGHIRNTFTGEIVSGEIKTPAGSTLVNDNLYYEQKYLDFYEKLSNSNNIFAVYAYSTANDAYMLFQILTLGLFDNRHYTNPLTGSYSYSNLDGTPRYDATDAIPGIVLSRFPVGMATPEGLKLLSKMNAAQFSHTFKGSLSRLKPAERGAINKSINKRIESFNGYVGSGKPIVTSEQLYNTYK